MAIDKLIDALIEREGYVNHPTDRGGPRPGLGSATRLPCLMAMYALFGTSYLGYTAARTRGKVEGVDN
ncbi:hypothetical protein [Sphingomonas xanthus]|uniref:Uncharacterized protein n=1 Tax=Sphingomonas xanthus TaxID=2594473 RepID=A0A516IQU5_9SPHN|nr:hypothetical protein [Sphingomonas xanthus]QDP19286.1 hypothetical protein FMM02_04485 [Sphingomonas xanthus]